METLTNGISEKDKTFKAPETGKGKFDPAQARLNEHSTRFLAAEGMKFTLDLRGKFPLPIAKKQKEQQQKAA